MSILVLGIGNLIMSDDGVGIRIVRQLAAGYRFPGGVALIEGETVGIDLLPTLEGVNRLLLVDAVETGGDPGAIVRLAADQIPMVPERRVSPHQLGLKDLLTLAAVQGFVPEETVLWGVQPEKIGLGLELSPVVADVLDRLASHVVAELERWGAGPLPAPLHYCARKNGRL